MANVFQRFVCIPTQEDEQQFALGATMDHSVLDVRFLVKHLDDPYFRAWYVKNLTLRVGKVTGGVLTEEDRSAMQFGVKLFGDSEGKLIPRMFHNDHVCSDGCYYCDIYRSNVLMQFGFESVKSLCQQVAGFSGNDTATTVEDDNGAFEDVDEDDDGAFEDADEDDDGYRFEEGDDDVFEDDDGYGGYGDYDGDGYRGYDEDGNSDCYPFADDWTYGYRN